MTQAAAPEGGRASDAALLADPDFRKIWLAGIANGIVRWFELLFIGIYVFQLTGSAFYVALVAVLRLGPIGPAGIVTGVLADAMGRRTLYLVATGLVVLVSAIQFVLALTGDLQLWHIAVGALLSGIYWATDLPLRRTMLGDVAGTMRMAPAMALDASVNNANRMLGPLIGGVLLETLGAAGAFLFSTLVNAAGFLLILFLRKDEPRPGPSATLMGIFMGGIAVARQNRAIVGTLMISVIFNVFGFPIVSMIPVIGTERFELSSAMIGLLMSAEGAGAFVGSLVLARLAPREALYQRIHWGGIIVCQLMIVAFVMSPWASLGWLSLFVMGLGIAGFSAMQTTLVMLSVEPHMRSRLMGLLAMSIGLGPLGFLHLGWLADQVGAPVALVIMAAEGMLCLVATLLYWPEIRK